MRRLVVIMMFLFLLPALAAAQSFCVDCLKVRVGRPYIARGPDATKVVENYFNEIKRSAGGYRAFTAQRDSHAIDGSTPWSMGATPVAVLTRTTNPASWASCGWWLNDTTWVGSTLYGYAHTENMGGNNCDYNLYSPNKSMTLVRSTDEGLHWTTVGQFITGRDSFTDGARETGEGDCTVVSSTGNNYIYCRRASDWKTIVAKAPITDPSPGNWKKFYDPTATDSRSATVTASSWSEPGLGGRATPLVDNAGGPLGLGASTFLVNGTDRNVMLLEHDINFGGLKASFSSDYVHFTRMKEPLLVLDGYSWGRPAATELVAYPDAIDNADGDDTWTTAFMLTHMYLEPQDAPATDGLFTQRFLVFRDVTVTVMPTPQTPQVGVALSRWSSTNDRWSTTAPVPGNFSTYTYEGDSGYLMTKPDPNQPTVKLVECISYWPGASDPDHVLTSNACDANSSQVFLRTAGWVYQNDQGANTHAIYRCYSSTLKTHFVSTQSDCEGLGTMEWRLGFALVD